MLFASDPTVVSQDGGSQRNLLNTGARVCRLGHSSMMSYERKLLSIALALLFYTQISQAQSPQDIEQLFSINRIVPDLLRSFKPTVALEVTYNATVIPGEIFSQTGIAYRLIAEVADFSRGPATETWTSARWERRTICFYHGKPPHHIG